MCQWIALVVRPVLLLDERPLAAGVQPWPPCSGECRPPLRPARQRLALDLGDDVVGQPARESLGLLLERDQDLLGEGAGAGLDVPGASSSSKGIDVQVDGEGPPSGRGAAGGGRYSNLTGTLT